MNLKPVWAVFVALGLATVAAAQLTINVDTSAQQYYLSGSATGAVGGDSEGGYKIFWDNGQPYNGGFPAFLGQTAFIATGNTTTSFTMFIHGNGNVNGVLNFSSGNAVTLTGNSSVRFDYSGWASSVITELESKAAAGCVYEINQVGVGGKAGSAKAAEVEAAQRAVPPRTTPAQPVSPLTRRVRRPEVFHKHTLAKTVATTMGSSQFTLTFTTAAIPEPTTYAALLGGAALVTALVRRHRSRPPLDAQSHRLRTKPISPGC